MHSFNHPSGVNIHYNGDYSGDALVILPDGREFEVPAKALKDFGRQATLDEVISVIEELD